MSPLLSTVLVLAQALPTFWAANIQVFEQIMDLRDLDTSDVPLRETQAPTSGKCARKCLLKSACAYFSFKTGSCSLFKTKPTPSGQAEDARYYRKFVPIPRSKGYTMAESERLCFKANTTMTTFIASGSQCKLEGGRRIILSKNERFDFVRQWIEDNHNSSEFWVDMRRQKHKNKWGDGSNNVRLWSEVPTEGFGCGLMSSAGLRIEHCNHNPKLFICEIVLYD